MDAAKHLFRYVKKTSHLSLRLGPFASKDRYRILYSNVDWAGDLDTRKSTGGYVCVLTEKRSPGRSLNGQQYHSLVKDNRPLRYPPPKPNIWLLPKQ